jgi:hypothetical protein
LQHLKWYVADNFLALFPPLLLALGFLAYGLQSLARPRRVLAVLCPLLVMLGAAYLLRTRSEYLGFWLVLGVAAFTLRVSHLLGVWFLLSFLPFLKLFTEQVHLAYALVPASIGLAGILEKAYPALGGASWRCRGVRHALTAVFLVALADHALNVYGSYRVIAASNRTIAAVGRWFRENVPPDAAVIGNALHLEDIRLASGGHFTGYWTVTAGIPHPTRALPDPAALARFLRENHGKRPVYFLDIDYPYTADKVGYHAHQYVRKHSVAVEKVGMVRALRVRYPYLDPFKALVPRHLISFLGSPDLENDYYRGPAQDGTPFLREVYAEYHVYRVVGTQVRGRTPGVTGQAGSIERRGCEEDRTTCETLGLPATERAEE